jgi:hypothetical protein
MKSWFSIATIAALVLTTTTAQSFDPNGVASDHRFDPAKVGTNKTTNATYSNHDC